MRLIASILGASLLLLGQVLPAAANDPVRHVRVHFERGTSGATLTGHIEGPETIEYKLNVRQGQMVRVDLHSRSQGIHFNVFEPGRRPGRDGALFIGEFNGNTTEFRTAHSGDYLVQVFLLRGAARRHEGADFSLRFDVTGGEAAHRAQPARSTDARVPGTEFNATGNLPCSRNRGQPMGSCRFGVVREGNGNGWITVFWPDGGNRVIFFEDNTPMRYDEAQADGGARMTVGHEGGLYHVRIGNMRFEIIEAIMAGG
jgi:hypothetical protein